MISVEDGRFILSDVSTNGVFVNGARQPAGRDAATILTDGDEFRFGDYCVTVAETADLHGGSYGGSGSQAGGSPFGAPFGSGLGGQSGGKSDAFDTGPVGGFSMEEGPLGGDALIDPFGHSPSPTFHHPQVHVARTERAIDPFDVAEESLQRGRAFDDDDLFAPKPADNAWKGGSQSDHLDARHQSFTAPKVVAPATMPVNMTDIDFDDLLGDLPPPGTPVAPPSPSGRQAQAPVQPVNFDDLSLDDLLGDAPPTPAPPAPGPAPRPAPAAAPPAAPVQDFSAFLDEPDDLRPAPAAPAGPAVNPFDEAETIGRPAIALDRVPAPPAPAAASIPEPVTVRPPPRPPRPAAPPAADASGAALWAAFLEGAGVPTLTAGQDDPEAAMRAAGEIFRVMVIGVREVLMSRAAIKSEMRVEQTVIRARDNNALKFSVTEDEAVSAMLMPNRAGYKAPLAASQEAFNDIKSHELAVMAGMQTALMSLLKRFDPESIEKRLQPGKLDGFLPGARRARIWEQFCATYKELAKEAEDDFQSVFGNEFARAYDAQMRKF